MSDGAKLAVDIGGTFTDLVLEKGGERHQAKLLTTPAAPEEAVLEGTKRISRSRIPRSMRSNLSFTERRSRRTP